MCLGCFNKREESTYEFRKISEFDSPMPSCENLDEKIKMLNKQINTLRIYSDLWDSELVDDHQIVKLKELSDRLEVKRNRLKKKIS